MLVDELAHTNAPGSRHAKRWQDIEELLVAGIEVWTTLNIQHLESLNDVVAQITGVVVRETLPDAVLERADEIELIDLTPEELVERLRAGKVYIPEQAERALQSFFQKSNLLALRELALRETADRLQKDVESARIERAALLAFRALKLRDYARIDFRISAQTGEPYILEVNPNPYLEKQGELAMAARERGMTYTQLVARIVELWRARDGGA